MPLLLIFAYLIFSHVASVECLLPRVPNEFFKVTGFQAGVLELSSPHLKIDS